MSPNCLYHNSLGVESPQRLMANKRIRCFENRTNVASDWAGRLIQGASLGNRGEPTIVHQPSSQLASILLVRAFSGVLPSYLLSPLITRPNPSHSSLSIRSHPNSSRSISSHHITKVRTAKSYSTQAQPKRLVALSDCIWFSASDSFGSFYVELKGKTFFAAPIVRQSRKK